MIVEVKPIEKKIWHGKSLTYGASRKVVGIKAKPNARTLKYETGLKAEDIKKLKGKIPFEINDSYKPGEVHPFWDTLMGTVRLEYRTHYFDTENPMDLIKLRLLQVSDLVANSIEELEDGMYPNALFVITNSREANKLKSKRFEQKQKLYSQLSGWTKEDKIDLLTVALKQDFSNMLVDDLNAKLEDLIESSPKLVKSLVDKGKKSIKMLSMVEKGFLYGVLRKDKAGRIMYKDVVLGTDIEEAALNLQDSSYEYVYAEIVTKF